VGRWLVLLIAAAVITVAAGPASISAAPTARPSPGPSPAATPNPTLAALARLSGAGLDVALLRELLPRFEEDIEIAYAATLNADHPPLLQWNQKMIERKSGQIKQYLAMLRDAKAAPGRRGVNIVTAEVKLMRQLKGAPLERRYMPLMIERFTHNVAVAELTVARSQHADLRALAAGVARIERQEIKMLQDWLKEWHGR
jgi:uncharacterized protein (DUF305 family)